ncbi:MAG: DUF669 domain-containing protein [Planctomycetia bacterium]|nr:DUF669 domain-containing protein [Planctomycetia bacterium]
MFGDSPRKLSDILTGESREELSRRFDEVEAAPDFAPVPPGSYEVDFVSGQLCQSQKGVTGYTCVFEIAAGEYRGRKIWHTSWLSEASLPYAKRDLKKLGINNLEQCEKPVPPGIYCIVKVVVRTEDDGTQRNRVTHIEAGGVRQDPTADPDFGMPATTCSAEGGVR